MTTPSLSTADAAFACWRAGFSVVPTRDDKRADFNRLPRGDDGKATWKPFQLRLATEAEMQKWFGSNGHSAYGYAIIGGFVSGNAECIDFDQPDNYPDGTAEKTLQAFAAKVKGLQPGLIDALSIIKTKGGGFHVWFRCESKVGGSAKLAMVPGVDQFGELKADDHGKIKPEVLIETRGEGGYAIGIGTPGYVYVSGPKPWETATLTTDEHDLLLTAARSFDQLGNGEFDFLDENPEAEAPGAGIRPGDDFNQRGEWGPLLAALGLKVKFKDTSGVEFLQRIGSQNPVGATLNFSGKNLLHVFSTNLALPAEKSYSKFAVYAHLHHAGDFSAAAKALAVEGYGSKTPTANRSRQEASPDIPIDDRHALRVMATRRTPSGKVTVQVKLISDNQPITVADVSSALSSQRAAVKLLAGFASVDHSTLAIAIGKVIADADERLRRAAESADEREAVRAIVARAVPPKFALKFRMADGKLWSDAWGRGVSRQEFLAFTPGWLIDLAKSACDADESDAAQLRAVQSALGILWASLQESLPNNAADSDLEAGTAAARRLEADVYRLWTSPALFKNVAVAGTDGEAGQVRASLASLVTEIWIAAKSGSYAVNRAKWQQIRSAVPAWFRIDVLEVGTSLRLAMRFNLFDALRIPCEFATDQKAMHAAGRKSGVFVDDGNISGRGSDGERLAILSPPMQTKILAQPSDDGSFTDVVGSH